MTIRIATNSDVETILAYDKHISVEELKNSIALSRIYIAEDDSDFIGLLRYNLFWDNTPFMNMLFIAETHRNKTYGSTLLSFWESEMRKLGYARVLTSTLSTETAQYFYQKRGYKNIGGFNLSDEPYEIIFQKEFDTSRN